MNSKNRFGNPLPVAENAILGNGPFKGRIFKNKREDGVWDVELNVFPSGRAAYSYSYFFAHMDDQGRAVFKMEYDDGSDKIKMDDEDA